MAIKYDYTVIRKPRRRSVMISISPRNHLTVTVPKGLSESCIQEFLTRQSAWIERKILRNQELLEKYPLKTYQTGDTFLYLGKPYRLEVTRANLRSVTLLEDRLCVAVESGGVDEMLRAWYEGMAYQVLKERVSYYQSVMKVHVANIQVRMLAGQWGSCAISGNLSFNARLIMAPLKIVDYVVVHELSHRKHHNHSPRFWQQVETVIPDYKERRKWLREHGQFLSL